jgi:hypothetical protein
VDALKLTAKHKTLRNGDPEIDRFCPLFGAAFHYSRRGGRQSYRIQGLREIDFVS